METKTQAVREHNRIMLPKQWKDKTVSVEHISTSEIILEFGDDRKEEEDENLDDFFGGLDEDK
jgi:hypothetical protein